jgi:hypothetical protein
MSCQEIVDSIAWSKKTSFGVGGGMLYGVRAYVTTHLGEEGVAGQHAYRDAVEYASGLVSAVDSPTPHLKGTLRVSGNTDNDGEMVSKPDLTFDIEIYPDGALVYQRKLKGKPIGGMPPTKLQLTCVDGKLLTGNPPGEAYVWTVGVERQPTGGQEPS